MKRKSMPPNKSVRKFAEDVEPFYEKNFRISNEFSSLKKRKPVHSTQKIYASNFFLNKKEGGKEKFMIFRDKDIGIYEYWQAHIHESLNDEDVDTDEDQKKIARNFCKKEIKEAFEYILQNKDEAFVNFNRFGGFKGNISNVEHEIKKYGTLVPKDFHKWAVICEHIIKHCNEGFAGGKHYGIEYFEICMNVMIK